MKQFVNAIGLYFGVYNFCEAVKVGDTTIYLHGTPDQIHAFGYAVIEAAQRLAKTVKQP